MIANTMILPTERPPTSLDIKRALITYDRVYLPSPDDREPIPPDWHMRAVTGGLMPINFGMGPVRPLGKWPGFDTEFEQLLKEFAPATTQTSLVMLSPPPPPLGFTIGNPPLPPDTPNPVAVFQCYRMMAAQPEFIAAASHGLPKPSHLADKVLEQLAPDGMDGEANTLPPPATISDPTLSDRDRQLMTRMARARLASLVKSLGICELKTLHPYTSDPASAQIMTTLTANANGLDPRLVSGETELASLTRLSRLHEILLADHVDIEALTQMSVADVLKLRTKAWGAANEARTSLFTKLREIAVEHPQQDKFEAACKTVLGEYLETRAELNHEWRTLRIKAYGEFGGAAIGATAGSDLLARIVGLGSLSSLVAIGGWLCYRAKDLLPQILDLMRQDKGFKSSTGYALATPYRHLIKPVASK